MRRTYLLGVFGVALVAALALTLVNLGPTVAQAASPPDRGPWPYQFYGSCSVTNCIVTLPAIPAGRRLVIQHVDVSASGATGVQPVVFLQVFWTGLPQGTIGSTRVLALTKTSSGQGVDNFAGNHQLLAFADASGSAKLQVNGGAYSLIATVSGYME